jgi:tripartite-type tricarboxylate transporter receptor subunit TctC
MSHHLRLLSVVAAGAFLATGGVAALAAEKGKGYYKGKTVEWIVSTAPGGGHDFWARLLSNTMEKKLPGSSFVVKNRPGAGHIIGVNLIYTSPPNGLTVGNFTTGLVYSQVLKQKGIRFDLAKMSWLGKLASEPRTMSVAANSRFKTFEDVLNSKEVVKFSASGVGSGSYTDSFMVGTAFGMRYKIITGYSGSQSTLALMRGEVDVLMGSEDSALAYQRAGQTRIVMQVGGNVKGVQDARDFAKNPQATAVMKLLADMGRLSRIVAGPPEIPADRLGALRAAFKESVEDAEFRAAAKKAGREIEPAYGDDVQARIAGLMQQPPEVIDLLKRLSTVKVDMLQHIGPVSKIEREGRKISIKHKGKEVSAKVSGSRTTITIDGKSAKRKAIKAGMTCTFTYPRAGAEAKRIDCKN